MSERFGSLALSEAIVAGAMGAPPYAPIRQAVRSCVAEIGLQQTQVVHGRNEDRVRDTLPRGEGKEVRSPERLHDDERGSAAKDGGDVARYSGDVTHRNGNQRTVGHGQIHTILGT